MAKSNLLTRDWEYMRHPVNSTNGGVQLCIASSKRCSDAYKRITTHLVMPGIAHIIQDGETRDAYVSSWRKTSQTIRDDGS